MSYASGITQEIRGAHAWTRARTNSDLRIEQLANCSELVG